MDICSIIKENGIISGSITVIIKDGIPLQIDVNKQVYRRKKKVNK